MSENELEARRTRLTELRERGVDPYPARVGPFVPVEDIHAEYGEKTEEELEAAAPPAAAVGRVRAVRSFGKLVFVGIEQDGVALQLSARKTEVPEDLFAAIKGLDVGDFVRAEGTLWRTKRGELTLSVASLDMLSKSLRPLPEKWHGLQDVEARFRQRYLDLLSNPEARRIAIARSRIVSACRSYLDRDGFLEVETPALQPLYGGAAARPFVTHHNVLDQQLYLRISDELYLKRLVIGGLDRVYEIAHNFRNEGVSRKHNPEFTLLEAYQAYGDYRDMMALAQGLIREVAESVHGGLVFESQGHTLDLSGEWREVSMRDAIREETGIDVLEARDLESLRNAAKQAGVEPGSAPTWGVMVDDLFSEHVEPGLIQPTFVTQHPTELSPLAKRSSEDPRVVERFELYLAGMELANAFSELNDPLDQRGRMEDQQALEAAGDEEAQPLDEDFLRALEHGMPPTGGIGIGIDRLVRVLLDTPSIREVILFPHLRSEAGT
ncbi:MAG: lysine--tRNA ligase [Myxococcota bacterium]|nr:lysine--tRNA ligase [Myxococcota bacterium]